MHDFLKVVETELKAMFGNYCLSKKQIKTIKQQVGEEERKYKNKEVSNDDVLEIKKECEKQNSTKKLNTRIQINSNNSLNKVYGNATNSIINNVFGHKTNFGETKIETFREMMKGYPCLKRKFYNNSLNKDSDIIIVDRKGNKKIPGYVKRGTNATTGEKYKISKYKIEIGDTLVEGYKGKNRDLFISTWRVASIDRKNKNLICVGTGTFDSISWTYEYMSEKYESCVKEFYFLFWA